MNRKYDIVFSDIDGTITDDDHRPMPLTAGKVRELEQGGIPVVLVSARPPMGVRYAQSLLGISSPMICFGGAYAVDGGRVIHDVGLPVEAALKVKSFFEERFPSVCVCSYHRDRWLCDDAAHRWVEVEKTVTGMTPEQLPLREYARENAYIHKLLCMGDPETMSKAEAELAALGIKGVSLTRSSVYYIEVTPEGVCKSAAMRVLCKARGTDVSRCVALGDNFNDLDMLKCAGLSIAMGNAPDEIKRQADAVTLDNNSEGVFHALEWIFA